MKQPQLLIVIVLAFISGTSYGQRQWNADSTIKWSDFKGVQHTVSEFSANTFSSIKCEYGNYSDTCFHYKVKAIFDPQQSWYSDTSNTLLDHERGHFNIAEVYARLIRKYLSERLKKRRADIDIDMGVNLLLRQEERYQSAYDKETNFSKDTVMQKNWQRKINKQLRELSRYTDPDYESCPASR